MHRASTSSRRRGSRWTPTKATATPPRSSSKSLGESGGRSLNSARDGSVFVEDAALFGGFKEIQKGQLNCGVPSKKTHPYCDMPVACAM